MIKVVRRGDYRLVETKDHSKVLVLDNKYAYKWLNTGKGQELDANHYVPQRQDHILASNKYRLYFVENEEKVSGAYHLELSVGQKKWQGYLLPIKLGANGQKKFKILATDELITKSCSCCPCEC